MKLTLSILLLLASFSLSLSLSCSSKEKEQQITSSYGAKSERGGELTPEQAQKLMIDTVIYAYPLVLMEKTRQVFTNVEKPTDDRAPINQFVHKAEFPDAKFKDVVSPNTDTLYSAAWLDLSEEPMMLSVPEMGKRYYLLPILSAWTDVVFSPGTRTTGQKKQTFAIVGPNWMGDLPANVTRIEVPTNTAWIIGRTQTNGKADYKNVRKLQAQYKLVPLSSWGKKYVPPKNESVDNSLDMKTPPPEQLAQMSATEFLRIFAEALKKNPPQADDTAMVDKIVRLGITPGQDFDAGKLSGDIRQAVEEGKKLGIEKVMELAGSGKEKESVGGWSMDLDMGVYGADYPRRAAVAFYALGANVPEDAVYPRATTDSNGQPLVGSNKYVIHFDKSELPPTKGFWSITLYNSQQYFFDNPLNRYAIGNRDKLKYNRDGSLDIYIQNEHPGKEKQSNWLPAPREEFNLMARLYWPDEKILSGEWRMPAIQRVTTPSGLTKR